LILCPHPYSASAEPENRLCLSVACSVNVVLLQAGFQTLGG
jgi:hypothetical protein